MTHYLPSFCETQGGLLKAVCGAWIARLDHRSEPACDRCQLWLTAEDAATSKVIARITPETPWGEERRYAK